MLLHIIISEAYMHIIHTKVYDREVHCNATPRLHCIIKYFIFLCRPLACKVLMDDELTINILAQREAYQTIVPTNGSCQ